MGDDSRTVLAHAPSTDLPSEAHDVFLSYASEDRDIAEAVKHALTGCDYTVFFDKSNLHAAENYHLALRKAIGGAKLFVFLVSADSVAQHRYTRTELKFARYRWDHPKGSVLPVMVRPVALSAVPTYLRAVTFLEPEGDIGAEVADQVSRLLPKTDKGVARTVRPKLLDPREFGDLAPFISYIGREGSVMLALSFISVLLAAAAVLIASVYPAVWQVGAWAVVAGCALATLASACFFGQFSHLTWLTGQIELTRVRRDATSDDLNECLLAIHTRDAWVRYRLGVMMIGAAAAAYAYAIVIDVLPWTQTVMWIAAAAAGLILIALGGHYYLSTRYPYAEAPWREWIERLVRNLAPGSRE